MLIGDVAGVHRRVARAAVARGGARLAGRGHQGTRQERQVPAQVHAMVRIMRDVLYACEMVCFPLGVSSH